MGEQLKILWVSLMILQISKWSVFLDDNPHGKDNTIKPGGVLWISWTIPDDFDTSDAYPWVGLYKVGTPDSEKIQMVYAFKFAPGSNWDIKMPDKVGEYEFRLFKPSSYERMAVSDKIIVKTKSSRLRGNRARQESLK